MFKIPVNKREQKGLFLWNFKHIALDNLWGALDLGKNMSPLPILTAHCSNILNYLSTESQVLILQVALTSGVKNPPPLLSSLKPTAILALCPLLSLPISYYCQEAKSAQGVNKSLKLLTLLQR